MESLEGNPPRQETRDGWSDSYESDEEHKHVSMARYLTEQEQNQGFKEFLIHLQDHGLEKAYPYEPKSLDLLDGSQLQEGEGVSPQLGPELCELLLQSVGGKQNVKEEKNILNVQQTSEMTSKRSLFMSIYKEMRKQKETSQIVNALKLIFFQNAEQLYCEKEPKAKRILIVVRVPSMKAHEPPQKEVKSTILEVLRFLTREKLQNKLSQDYYLIEDSLTRQVFFEKEVAVCSYDVISELQQIERFSQELLQFNVPICLDVDTSEEHYSFKICDWLSSNRRLDPKNQNTEKEDQQQPLNESYLPSGESMEDTTLEKSVVNQSVSIEEEKTTERKSKQLPEEKKRFVFGFRVEPEVKEFKDLPDKVKDLVKNVQDASIFINYQEQSFSQLENFLRETSLKLTSFSRAVSCLYRELKSQQKVFNLDPEFFLTDELEENDKRMETLTQPIAGFAVYKVKNTKMVVKIHPMILQRIRTPEELKEIILDQIKHQSNKEAGIDDIILKKLSTTQQISVVKMLLEVKKRNLKKDQLPQYTKRFSLIMPSAYAQSLTCELQINKELVYQVVQVQQNKVEGSEHRKLMQALTIEKKTDFNWPTSQWEYIERRLKIETEYIIHKAEDNNFLFLESLKNQPLEKLHSHMAPYFKKITDAVKELVQGSYDCSSEMPDESRIYFMPEEIVQLVNRCENKEVDLLEILSDETNGLWRLQAFKLLAKSIRFLYHGLPQESLYVEQTLKLIENEPGMKTYPLYYFSKINHCATIQKLVKKVLNELELLKISKFSNPNHTLAHALQGMNAESSNQVKTEETPTATLQPIEEEKSNQDQSNDSAQLYTRLLVEETKEDKYDVPKVNLENLNDPGIDLKNDQELIMEKIKTDMADKQRRSSSAAQFMKRDKLSFDYLIQELEITTNPNANQASKRLYLGSMLRSLIDGIQQQYEIREDLVKNIDNNSSASFNNEGMADRDLKFVALIKFGASVKSREDFRSIEDTIRSYYMSNPANEQVSTVDMFKQKYPNAWYGDTVFDFFAMLSIVVPESKLGKYEDNMRRQVGVERMYKINEHLKLASNIKARTILEEKIRSLHLLIQKFRNHKMSLMMEIQGIKWTTPQQNQEATTEQLSQNQEAISNLDTQASTHFPGSEKIKAPLINQEIPEHEQAAKIQVIIEEIIKHKQELEQLNQETKSQKDKKENREQIQWVEPQKVKDTAAFIHDLFGKLSLLYDNDLLFQFIRKQNILNRDLSKIGSNINKTLKHFQNLFQDQQVEIHENLKSSTDIKEDFLLKAAITDQTLYLPKSDHIVMISMMEQLGYYIQKMFFTRFFLEDLSLVDFSQEKCMRYLAYFDAFNLPTLILAENNLSEYVKVEFKTKNGEMDRKKILDTVLISKQLLELKEKRLTNMKDFTKGLYRYLLDPHLEGINNEMSESSGENINKLKTEKEHQNFVQSSPFSQRVLHFYKNSLGIVHDLVSMLNHDHNPHKNFFYRLIAAKYLSSLNLQETYEFFKNLLEGQLSQNRDGCLTFSQMMRLDHLKARVEEPSGDLCMPYQNLNIDWVHIVDLVKSKYYMKLFPPNYAYGFDPADRSGQGSFYYGYIGPFQIVKIRFPSSFELNVCKFYVHFFNELVCLFNYVERKAAKQDILISEKVFNDLRQQFRVKYEKGNRSDGDEDDQFYIKPTKKEASLQ